MSSIVITDIGELDKRVWTFWVSYPTLILDSFSILSRSTTRHKFKVDQVWQRLNRRNNTMSVLQVPRPAWIEEEALRLARAALTVVTLDNSGARPAREAFRHDGHQNVRPFGKVDGAMS